MAWFRVPHSHTVGVQLFSNICHQKKVLDVIPSLLCRHHHGIVGCHSNHTGNFSTLSLLGQCRKAASLQTSQNFSSRYGCYSGVPCKAAPCYLTGCRTRQYDLYSGQSAPFMTRASDYRAKNSEDGIPGSYRMVYVSTLQRSLSLSYVIVALTCLPSIAHTVYRLSELWASTATANTAAAEMASILLDMDSPLLMATAGSLFGMGVLLTLRLALVRNISRLYYDEERDCFAGITQTSLLTRRRVDFSPSDITDKRQDGVVTIHGRKYFFKIADFRAPRYYNAMMGYIKEDSR